MAALIRKYGLFYLTATGTFFLLSAYSLAANAPNYPFLPALFFPIYLCGAVAMSERETGDPLLDILPITPHEIMQAKFGLGFAFVVVGWLNMSLFTIMQNLGPDLTVQVLKLNTIGAVNALLLAALIQLGINFFGWTEFQKVIIVFTFLGGLFGIIFFIGLAESGHNHPGNFPLMPFLESLPWALLMMGVALVGVSYFLIMRYGPWAMWGKIQTNGGDPDPNQGPAHL